MQREIEQANDTIVRLKEQAKAEIATLRKMYTNEVSISAKRIANLAREVEESREMIRARDETIKQLRGAIDELEFEVQEYQQMGF